MIGSQRTKRRLSDAGPPMSPFPVQQKSSEWTLRCVVALLVALYITFAAIHAMVTPTGQNGYQDAPDEAAHLSYVRALSEGHLPSRANPTVPGGDKGVAYEWHQPPLYYALDVPFFAMGEKAARLLSILCGVICLLLIYRILRIFSPDDPFPAILAVGIAALTPGHIAITSSVSNDSLLEVWFSSVLLVLISAIKGGFTIRRACWLGLMLAAAILTKLTGLLLIPIATMGLLLCIRGGEKPENVLKNFVVSAIIVLVLCSGWLVRNARLYHELVPLHAFQQAFAGTAQAQNVVDGKVIYHVSGWSGYIQLVSLCSFESFWAVYGTPQSAKLGVPVFLPVSVYLLMAVVCLVAFIGLARLHFRRMTAFTAYQRHTLWIQFLSIALVGLAFVVFLSHYFQAQGRYLYPAMSGITMVLALGWLEVFPVRYRKLAGGFLLTVLGLLSVDFLLTITNHP